MVCEHEGNKHVNYTHIYIKQQPDFLEIWLKFALNMEENLNRDLERSFNM